MDSANILTTINGRADPYWQQFTEYIAPPSDGLLPWVWSLAHRARRSRAVILRGTSGADERYRDLLAAAAIRFIAPNTQVIISDATIAPGSRALAQRSRLLGVVAPVLARLLVRLADSGRVTWCVLSRAEVANFPDTWGVGHGRVVFTPFAHTLWRGEARRDYPSGNHLFSGGNSLRDYDLLAAACAGIAVPVVVACSSWRPRTAPAGFDVAPRTHEQFIALLAGSRAVVLCLQPGTRSTGQQTYLNAMALGRPVIVTDTPGVRDHIEDGVTGVVVAPTTEAVRAAVRDVLDPTRRETYQTMGARAREAVRDRFTDVSYRRRLLSLADRKHDLPALDQAVARVT